MLLWYRETKTFQRTTTVRIKEIRRGPGFPGFLIEKTSYGEICTGIFGTWNLGLSFLLIFLSFFLCRITIHEYSIRKVLHMPDFTSLSLRPVICCFTFLFAISFLCDRSSPATCQCMKPHPLLLLLKMLKDALPEELLAFHHRLLLLLLRQQGKGQH